MTRNRSSKQAVGNNSTLLVRSNLVGFTSTSQVEHAARLWSSYACARYVIDQERRLMISTGWDRVTFAEIVAHRGQLASDPEFDPEFDQLVDGRAVTELDLSLEDAKAIASRSLFSSSSRRAFVASDLAILGMARLVETYSRQVRGGGRSSCFPQSSLCLEMAESGEPSATASGISGTPRKGTGLKREEIPPVNWIAPPGSNRSGGVGDKTAGASRVEGNFVSL